ncbi:MAG TPA: SpoIIE family protein phosphatase [Thermoanaerobaculaceae bacterium]|nr:SpoIIE family protein phosphatase [Thermoanaerobaculaceae bacterium]
MLLHLTDNSPEPMRDQIARQLRGRILTGDVGEGSALPQTHRIAREHRVSPRDVRRAFEELAEEGLLRRDGEERYVVATLPASRRRELAVRRLADDPREQELSLRELEIARDIQRRLLPPALVTGEGYAVASRSFAARFVAGDFYDVLRHPDGSVGVVVADVAGKGFGASLLMASVKAMAPFVAAGCGVAETLHELNRRLHAELGRGQFVALAYARFTPATGVIELANAGMPDPFVMQPGAPPFALEVPGPRLPLGLRDDVAYTSVTRTVGAGARVLLFSDGIPEARRPSGEQLGYDGLADAVARVPAGGRGPVAAQAWLDALLDEVERRTSPVQDDDWTAVVVDCPGPGGA